MKTENHILYDFAKTILFCGVVDLLETEEARCTPRLVTGIICNGAGKAVLNEEAKSALTSLQWRGHGWMRTPKRLYATRSGPEVEFDSVAVLVNIQLFRRLIVPRLRPSKRRYKQAARGFMS